MILNRVNIRMNVWMDEAPVNGELDGKFKAGELEISKLEYFSFDKDVFSRLKINSGGVWSNIGFDYSRVEKPNGYIESDNSGWIFFNETNCFAHFSGHLITFRWEL
jgi:hypothetical protein